MIDSLPKGFFILASTQYQAMDVIILSNFQSLYILKEKSWGGGGEAFIIN